MRLVYVGNPHSHHDRNWIREILRPGDSALLFCSRNTRGAPDFDDRVEIAPLLPNRFPVHRVARRRAVARELAERCSDFRGDLVHSLYALPNAIWASFLGIPHVVTTRGSDVLRDYPQIQRPRGVREVLGFRRLRRLFEEALHTCDAITCTSASQVEAVRSIVGSDRRIDVVRTGVDLERFAGARIKETSARPVLLSSRVMKPLYRQDLLIKAVELLTQQGRDCRLRLVDDEVDPEYSQLCRELCRSLGISHEIVPPVPEEGVAALYEEADVVVMLPETDGSPVSGLECMAALRPLVLGDADYDGELFSDSWTWRIDRCTPEGVAACLEMVLERKREAQRRCVEARQVVERHADRVREMERVRSIYARLGVAPMTSQAASGRNE